MTTRWTSWIAATVVAGSAMLPIAWPAAADDTVPPPAPEPPSGQTIIPPGGLASITSVLAQNGSASTGPLGLPDLSAYGANLLLGQNTAPAAPADATLAGIYPLSAFQSNYLLPENLTPSAPGKGTLAPGIGPDEDDPGTGRIAFLKRLHDMYAAGELKGALLGQKPLASWDEEVLPQDPTAPPTAVNIPH